MREVVIEVGVSQRGILTLKGIRQIYFKDVFFKKENVRKGKARYFFSNFYFSFALIFLPWVRLDSYSRLQKLRKIRGQFCRENRSKNSEMCLKKRGNFDGNKLKRREN